MGGKGQAINKKDKSEKILSVFIVREGSDLLLFILCLFMLHWKCCGHHWD